MSDTIDNFTIGQLFQETILLELYPFLGLYPFFVSILFWLGLSYACTLSLSSNLSLFLIHFGFVLVAKNRNKKSSHAKLHCNLVPNRLKYNHCTTCLRRKFYLIWFTNFKPIRTNLCYTVKFCNGSLEREMQLFRNCSSGINK